MRNRLNYIFCISPGRCGTDYLTELLAQTQDTVSIHEGLPIMNGEPMIRFNQFQEAPLRQLALAKHRAIQAKQKRRVYCETNHAFIKGWGWLVPDNLAPQAEIGVITLRRDREANALSLLRLRDVPGISEFSRTWYLDPWAPRNIESAPKEAGLFERCLWYIDETYRRAEAFKQTFPNIRYWDCELAQLNNPAYVEQMFTHFDLRPATGLAAAIGKRLNAKDAWPRLSKEQLLDWPAYPNPDELPGAQRDELLHDMIRWLREYRSQAIAQLKPDPLLFGSVATQVPRVVAEAEPELEQVFRTRLRFTETERLLLGELVHAINPRDFAFLAVERSSTPHLWHRYDFNFQLSLRRILRRVGFVGVLIGLRAMAQGLWWRDPSHASDSS